MPRAVLERLHAGGRLGAYWWCWADYDDALRRDAAVRPRPARAELRDRPRRRQPQAGRRDVGRIRAGRAQRRRSPRSSACSSRRTTPISRARRTTLTRGFWSSTCEDDPGHRRLLRNRTSTGRAGGARRLRGLRGRAQRQGAGGVGRPGDAPKAESSRPMRPTSASRATRRGSSAARSARTAASTCWSTMPAPSRSDRSRRRATKICACSSGRTSSARWRWFARR